MNHPPMIEHTPMTEETSTPTTKPIKGKRQPKEKAVKPEPELCSICADHYTPILRKKVICKFCNKDTCCKCIEQYLLNRHEDAHCVHCRVNYSDQVLRDICTKTYLQHVYFKHRQEVLINRERVALPALQENAMNVKQIRQINTELRKLSDEKKELDKILCAENKNEFRIRIRIAHSSGATAEQLDELQKELKSSMDEQDTLYARRKEIRKLRSDKNVRIWRIRHGRDPETGLRPGEVNGKKADEEKDEKRKFVRRCVRANCTGFLSTAWKCGICEWYSCSKCFNVRGEFHDTPHECQKEDLETAELIRSQSKPCPGCGEFIEKSSGCNQMYCISCHTPWDWDSGKIVTHGVIHNPHYYEWLRRTGGGTAQRNPADVPCGGYPNAWDLITLRGYPQKQNAIWFEFHRLCMDIQAQSQGLYRTHLDQQHTNAIHIRYLLGDYTEKKWGQLLAINEKKKKRDTEIQDVFNAFRMVAVELINRIQLYRDAKGRSFVSLSYTQGEPIVNGVIQEMLALVDMVNDAFKTISISHCYSVPFIRYDDSIPALLLRTQNHSSQTKRRRVKQPGEEDEKEGDVAHVAAAATDVLEEDEKVDEEPSDEPLNEETFDEEPVEESEDEDEILQVQRAIALSYKGTQASP